MFVTIVGGGNVGTQFAAHCAAKGHSVTVYTPRYAEFSRVLEVVDQSGKPVCSGEIAFATHDAKTAFERAELVFVTTPSFMAERIYGEISPYIKRGALVGFIPGTGGMECAFGDLLPRGCTLFGLQRVPSVARLITYGSTVCAEGYRDRLHLGALPKSRAEHCCQTVGDIFGIPCEAVPYVSVTLTPSNPILHTSRLYGLFGDYAAGKIYAHMPMFYEDWDLKSSELLLACDAEVMEICRAIGPSARVKSLKEHYESPTAELLTKKISGIKGFKGIATPAVKVEGGFLPDFNSRYFTADFPYGLAILIGIADLYGVSAPTMRKIYGWYEGVTGNTSKFDFKNYGITTRSDFEKFYSI